MENEKNLKNTGSEAPQNAQESVSSPVKQESGQVALLEHLTPKNRLFLHLLLEGKGTIEAYEAAGYSSTDPHAAYVLKSRLNKELEAMATARGCSRAHLMTEISKLNDLPVVSQIGVPLTGLTANQKLKLLTLEEKVLESQKAEKASYTSISILRYNEEQKKPENVLDAEIVESTIMASPPPNGASKQRDEAASQ